MRHTQTHSHHPGIPMPAPTPRGVENLFDTAVDAVIKDKEASPEGVCVCVLCMCVGCVGLCSSQPVNTTRARTHTHSQSAQQKNTHTTQIHPKHTHTHTHTHTHYTHTHTLHTHTLTHTHKLTPPHLDICMYVCMCVCMCVCLFVITRYRFVPDNKFSRNNKRRRTLGERRHHNSSIAEKSCTRSHSRTLKAHTHAQLSMARLNRSATGGIEST